MKTPDEIIGPDQVARLRDAGYEIMGRLPPGEEVTAKNDEGGNLYGVEFIGPFPRHYRVGIDGYLLPNITAHLKNWKVSLTVDRRLASEFFDADVVQGLVPTIANAAAVSGGFSAHGENSLPINPHKLRYSMLGTQTGPNLRPVS